MPVTLTLTELAAALRLSDGSAMPEEPLQSILGRLLEAARERVNQYSPAAPDQVLNSAVVSICGYGFDSTSTALNNAPAQDAFRMSGAMAILAPYHEV